MRMISIFLFLILIAPALPAQDSARADFEFAAKKYSEGSYDEAIDGFQKLVNEGYESPDLYSNLGSAYYKNGKIGKAVLFFERSIRLDPGNEDLQHNLMVARARTRDRIEPIPLLFFVQWWNDLKDSNTDSALLIWTVVFAWTLAATVFVFFGYRRVLLRRIALASMTLVGALFVCSAVMYVSKVKAIESSREAVVMPAEVTVRSTPDASGIESFTVHEGLTVTILGQKAGYWKIRLLDGKLGWVKEDAIERI